MSNQTQAQQLAADIKYAEARISHHKRERITAARQRLATLLDADTYDCATLHTAARDLLTALEG